MKISLVHKLVLGILIVSLTTYGSSAVFIFILKPLIAPDMKDWIYVSGVLFLGVFWTCFLGWIAAQLIIRPLQRLTGTAVTVASGNLDAAIPKYRSKDEIGHLHESFRIMLHNLRQMIQEVSNSVTVTDQNIVTLGSAIRQATSQIETIAVTIDRIADSASMQAESAQKMLDSAKQAAETAHQMNSKAKQAIAVTKTMVSTIGDSSEKLHSLVDGMLHISETSGTTLNIVRSLEQKANEISKITQLVAEIADQTHLLALNASIEAAHAGEQGQGFAVVAQQIRRLAQDSSNAVEHINQLVQQMQEQTITVVRETMNQVELIRKETANGEHARQALDQVTSSVNETAKALQSIVDHITEQTEQINRTFEMAQGIAAAAVSISEGNSRISNAAQEQTAVMQEISASSELLRAEAENLKQKTVVFNLS